ncbi:TolB family protein [Acanthopleuribacter pedis]|uniref:TolB family protein n=1 Tax=Acanthopleuribacter pedis TaxID=442870 RepID=A0A8J7QF67_9BACT|nr:DPP IV N-terminal domain-containing protein [Acanthopleuribacter pedis]MBO1318710.1 TolB family protein [Acanthopleuribacter pedis]
MCTLGTELPTPKIDDRPADMPGYIVYASYGDNSFLSIYRIQPNGTQQRLLVPGKVGGRGSHQPHVSPDGKQIAFNTYQYSGWKFAIADLDGKNMRRVTKTPLYEYDPVWHPDGKQLVCNQVITEGPPYFRGHREIVLVDVATGERRVLTHNEGRNTNPSFSPDGKSIVWDSAAAGNYDIWLMDADGKNQRNLTNTSEHDLVPSFSPDGKRIAFQRVAKDSLDLWVMNADGSNPINLTGARKLGYHLANSKENLHWKLNTDWSPDGRYVVFVSGEKENGALNLNLYVAAVDGSTVARLTQTKGDAIQPVWVVGP